MSTEMWSDNIITVELQPDPGFTDDMAAVLERLADKNNVDVVINFAAVDYLNSSNIAKLLKLRKTVISHKRRLVLCGINTNAWGIFLVTGLDNVFEFADNLATALAMVQLAGDGEEAGESRQSAAD